jgi:hypothetical protein
VKTTSQILCALLLCCALLGCGGSQPAAPAKPAATPASAPASTAPAATTPAPAAAEKETPAPPATPAQPDTAVSAATEQNTPPASGGGSIEQLLNTAWKFADGTTLKFKDASTVNVSGGRVAFLGSSGIDAKMTLDPDGTLTITAMGTTVKGKWDGKTVSMDGNEAVKQ